ncbi:hypothetical protein [Herbiconiux daphne]|uniref:Uncharacterized protein n=1 Tax=Herbiconiux daphne TaxID=2970914 RepID=A0ABT2HAE3_9MICO|nr:hypothetical protein [Herbiconiux daphne]MCS5736842.1 hypothetical protein [Herbiconiux daphne]
MKNGKYNSVVWYKDNSFQENYSQLICKIANAMGVLATKEEMLSLESERIYFDTLKKEFWFDYSRYIYGTTIKDGKASEIVKLLNNSPLMEEFR